MTTSSSTRSSSVVSLLCLPSIVLLLLSSVAVTTVVAEEKCRSADEQPLEFRFFTDNNSWADNGWTLECEYADATKAMVWEVPIGSLQYEATTQVIREAACVPDSATCTLQIYDTSGDGLQSAPRLSPTGELHAAYPGWFAFLHGSTTIGSYKTVVNPAFAELSYCVGPKCEQAPQEIPTNGDSCQDLIYLALQLDATPEETSYQLICNDGQDLIWDGKEFTNPGQFIEEEACIPHDTCCQFVIQDSSADGLSSGLDSTQLADGTKASGLVFLEANFETVLQYDGGTGDAFDVLTAEICSTPSQVATTEIDTATATPTESATGHATATISNDQLAGAESVTDTDTEEQTTEENEATANREKLASDVDRASGADVSTTEAADSESASATDGEDSSVTTVDVVNEDWGELYAAQEEKWEEENWDDEWNDDDGTFVGTSEPSSGTYAPTSEWTSEWEEGTWSPTSEGTSSDYDYDSTSDGTAPQTQWWADDSLITDDAVQDDDFTSQQYISDEEAAAAFEASFADDIVMEEDDDFTIVPAGDDKKTIEEELEALEDLIIANNNKEDTDLIQPDAATVAFLNEQEQPHQEKNGMSEAAVIGLSVSAGLLLAVILILSVFYFFGEKILRKFGASANDDDIDASVVSIEKGDDEKRDTSDSEEGDVETFSNVNLNEEDMC